MQIYTKYERDYQKACNRFIEMRAEILENPTMVSDIHVCLQQANFVLSEVLEPFTAISIVE